MGLRLIRDAIQYGVICAVRLEKFEGSRKRHREREVLPVDFSQRLRGCYETLDEKRRNGKMRHEVEREWDLSRVRRGSK